VRIGLTCRRATREWDADGFSGLNSTGHRNGSRGVAMLIVLECWLRSCSESCNQAGLRKRWRMVRSVGQGKIITYHSKDKRQITGQLFC
jgi:hypothetical protein